MTESPSAKELVETFLSIIRQQRHFGVRTVICTQEPTVSPKLIELSSIIVIHRFTSPEWYKVIQKHVPMDIREVGSNENGIQSDLRQIASLRTGEAIIFAPSAYLMGEKDIVLDTRHRTFRMLIRRRVTWDGGRTVVCIR
jgi:DNA helicase HerA-like ATPase